MSTVVKEMNLGKKNNNKKKSMGFSVLAVVAVAVVVIIVVLLVMPRKSADVSGPRHGEHNYTVKFCVADKLGGACENTATTAQTQHMESPVEGDSCDATVDQKGSVTWADLLLPEGKVLLVEVTTHVKGQTSASGFFVRPSRLTAQWGKAKLVGTTSASFYLAQTGQFSVEFAPDSLWREKSAALSFPALMLFVNPQFSLPKDDSIIYLTKDDIDASPFDLGPSKSYIFMSDESYDWGRAQVFKVHDDTNVYFEPGAFVRARIIQTEEKVKNVLISGYGVLDNHYPPTEYDIQGLSDDGSMQTITIYGKNIRVYGVTMLNTNKKCHAFGYCLNLNANWSPLANVSNPFEASELQNKDPPYKYHKAHCQELNMDGTPNNDFINCPTSSDDGIGNKVKNVKCMTWQMGQDGLNAGKFGTVEDSFIRVIDDALKPWDSNGVYRNIVIWQLTLGWPINLGWWNWGAEEDQNTIISDIFLIHNHNWVSSKDWPESESGQCVIGGVYGSGVVKRSYMISNVFVETACSCAIGLAIDKSAYNRHLTPDGCVGSINNLEIKGMYVDEAFFEYTGGYTNFISGEQNPNVGCTGAESGSIEFMSIAVSVDGTSMKKTDFVVDDNTVKNLSFSDPRADPYQLPTYIIYDNKKTGNGITLQIDNEGVEVASSARCVARCHTDLSCECAEFEHSTSKCWKYRGCSVDRFDSDVGRTVLMRPSV